MIRKFLKKLFKPKSRVLREYEIIEEVNRGGMSVIYKAVHKMSGAVVALKILLPRFTQKREMIESLLNEKQVEGEIAAKLDHPNIIKTYDYGRDGDSYFFIMEHVDGMNLERRLELGDPFVREHEFSILLQAAEGLAYLHDQGIIHRDICPSNILVSNKGEVKITDLGLAVLKSGIKHRIGERAGTPSYMSPEQVRGQEIDERSDIYSFGVLMYRMLTGRTPFKGEDSITRMQRQLNIKPIEPRQIDPTIHPDVEKIILKAMEKDKEARYQNMHELIADLRRIGRTRVEEGEEEIEKEEGRGEK